VSGTGGGPGLPAGPARLVTALAVQTGPAGDDLDKNLRAASELARSAPSAGGGLVVFPELFSRPFWCLGMSDARYFGWAEPVTGPTLTHAAELAAELGSVVVAPFFECGAVAGEYFNSVAVIGPDGRLLPGRLADGTPVNVYRKNAISAYRWGEAVNDEKFYFKPGNLGYPVFKTKYADIGVYICYDRHFPEGARELGLNGAEIVFNPSATVAGLSEYLWKLEQPAHAVANAFFVGAINRVGFEKPWNIGEFYGQSYFCDPRGQIVAQASRDKDELVVADLDLDKIREVRNVWQFYRDRRPETYGGLCKP